MQFRLHRLNTMASDIQLFMMAGRGRHMNDRNNHTRERILANLLNPPQEYLEDPEHGSAWSTMSDKWRNFLHVQTPVEYDNILIKKMGGRKYNYDLEIKYLRGNDVVHEMKAEFKHNCGCLDKLPEYYNAPENKGYIPASYAEYFYNNYVPHIANVAGLEVPTKENYMKYIYQSDYSKLPFFQGLKDSTNNEVLEVLKTSAKESIRNYLDEYAMSIDFREVARDIQRSQGGGKTFILWDCQTFTTDRLMPEELDIVNVNRVRNGNTIVLNSAAGTQHKLLLRWKNHLGILFPAWQISLERPVGQNRALF